MSTLVHALLHALALVASVSTVALDVVPAKYRPLVVAVVSLAQAVLALVNHGTPPTQVAPDEPGK